MPRTRARRNRNFGAPQVSPTDYRGDRPMVTKAFFAFLQERGPGKWKTPDELGRLVMAEIPRSQWDKVDDTPEGWATLLNTLRWHLLRVGWGFYPRMFHPKRPVSIFWKLPGNGK